MVTDDGATEGCLRRASAGSSTVMQPSPRGRMRPGCDDFSGGMAGGTFQLWRRVNARFARKGLRQTPCGASVMHRRGRNFPAMSRWRRSKRRLSVGPCVGRVCPRERGASARDAPRMANLVEFQRPQTGRPNKHTATRASRGPGCKRPCWHSVYPASGTVQTPSDVGCSRRAARLTGRAVRRNRAAYKALPSPRRPSPWRRGRPLPWA